METIGLLRNIARKLYPKTYVRAIYSTTKPIRIVYNRQISPVFTNHLLWRNPSRNYAKKAQGKLSKGGKVKKVVLTDEELSDVVDIEQYRAELKTIVDKLKQDFADRISIRTTASQVDTIMVTIEDQEYPLTELAQISKKGSNLIAINMSEFPEGLKPAIQAITESGMGVNPQQEGTMIYIPIPKLTREYRESLAKNAKSLFVKAKEESRQIQNTFVKDAKRKTELSEDLVFNASNQIMSIAEEHFVEMEKVLKAKHKELLGES